MRMDLFYILVSCLGIYGSTDAQTTAPSMELVATCNMKPNQGMSPTDPLYQDIYGTVLFSQTLDRSLVHLQINITGFSTADNDTTHGFHVHEMGDIDPECEESGPHFNPYNAQHGGPESAERHVGDLGNIVEDANGNVITEMTDGVIKFEGQSDIGNRTLDIHAMFDDLSPASSGGNAGKRIACCIITLVQTQIQRNTAASLVGFKVTSFVPMMLVMLRY